MTSQKSQNSNMLLAFLTLLGVIVLVAVVGFFMLRKGPEIIQGQAEVTEYRVSSKVPGRILEFRVKEGQKVQAGDTLAILEAPDVIAKMEQARAAEAAAQAQNEKAIKGARQEQIQAAYEMWQKAIAGVDIAEKSYKRVKIYSTKELCRHRNWTKSPHNVMQPSQPKKRQRPNTRWQRTVPNVKIKWLQQLWWTVPRELLPKWSRTSKKLI